MANHLDRKFWAWRLENTPYPGDLIEGALSGERLPRFPVSQKKEEKKNCLTCGKPLSQYDVDVGRTQHMDCI